MSVSSGWFDLDDAAASPVLDLPCELPAGGVDVLAPGLADRCDEARILQYFLKRDDAVARASAELGIRERVERNQVELARHVPHQRDQRARLFGRVVDVVEHDVFEGHEVS